MKIIKSLIIVASPLIAISFIISYIRWGRGLELLGVIFLFYLPTTVLYGTLLFHLIRGLHEDVYMKIFYSTMLLIVYTLALGMLI